MMSHAERSVMVMEMLAMGLSAGDIGYFVDASIKDYRIELARIGKVFTVAEDLTIEGMIQIRRANGAGGSPARMQAIKKLAAADRKYRQGFCGVQKIIDARRLFHERKNHQRPSI